MEVKETGLKFNGSLRPRTSTQRIIIHHSASPDVPASRIHSWHLARGWSGIGYHYVIRQNGIIERGRPEYLIGAHAGSGGNPSSIGICLTGNFNVDPPEEAQIKALVWLIKDIWRRYTRLELIGHRDVMATDCPGEKFPWTELKRRLEENSVAEQWKLDIMDEARKTGIISSEHKPDDRADKWFVLAVALNVIKVLKKNKED